MAALFRAFSCPDPPEVAEHWFRSLAEARQIVGTWHLDYNQVRPHSALSYRMPAEFAVVWRAKHSGLSSQKRTS